MFYQQQPATLHPSSESKNNQQNNKRYASKKSGSVQPYPGQGNPHTNLISEGALSQLINTHINEGSGSHDQTQDSFENANLAFWTRKQNEYKSNLQGQ